jgi:hypothetical protein
VYKFQEPFGKQPQFFMANSEQSIYVISNKEDTRHINVGTKTETDITRGCGVTAILKIIYDPEDKKFFIMANKCDYLGLYIVKLDALNPQESCFIIKWQSKLLNGDGNMIIFRNKQRGLKELIVSYKTIYILTYNLILLDITTENDPSMIFRHESFQLFESDCSGFFLGKNNDFMHLSKHGMQVMGLSSTDKRAVVDDKGTDRMIHSLESCNYLKVDKNNYLLFECAKPTEKIISV